MAGLFLMPERAFEQQFSTRFLDCPHWSQILCLPSTCLGSSCVSYLLLLWALPVSFIICKKAIHCLPWISSLICCPIRVKFLLALVPYLIQLGDNFLTADTGSNTPLFLCESYLYLIPLFSSL